MPKAVQGQGLTRPVFKEHVLSEAELKLLSFFLGSLDSVVGFFFFYICIHVHFYAAYIFLRPFIHVPATDSLQLEGLINEPSIPAQFEAITR